MKEGTRVSDEYSFSTITGTADVDQGIGASDGAERKDWCDGTGAECGVVK